ncbi:MAG: zinc-binding dehydrogenase [Nanoarchaeota archaeon]|nr:zinc-binding dehydrogenase [Nanoarchaeota archaeon]MCG2719083.1 zinc-binding dehydrogenase [Nanoarchaeota archaeon]
MKTRTVVLYELNKPLVIEELEIPKLKQGQVLVKIMYAGICRSQLNEIKGKKGVDKYLPHTLGHEAGAIVEEVGENVTKVNEGDHVVLSWIKDRETVNMVRTGTHSVRAEVHSGGIDAGGTKYRNKEGKIINAGGVTTFGKYSVVSENRVTKIDKRMPLDKSALLGCAIPTGGGIIIHQIKPTPGDSIAIIGAGGVGTSAILLSSVMGCSPIIVVDINEKKLDFAHELGATDMINAKEEDFVPKILELTNGKGVDYAVEAVGSKETIEKSFASVKWDGGLVVIGGNPPSEQKISIDPFDLKGKLITGSWGGLTVPHIDIPKYVNLYLSGKLKLDELITDRFRFDEINKAFELLDRGKIVGRAILEINKEA